MSGADATGGGRPAATASGEGVAPVIPISVARGNATPEEVAVLVAVLAAAGSSATDDPAPRPTSVWAARERLVRAPHVHGRGAWRASAWPR